MPYISYLQNHIQSISISFSDLFNPTDCFEITKAGYLENSVFSIPLLCKALLPVIRVPDHFVLRSTPSCLHPPFSAFG